MTCGDKLWSFRTPLPFRHSRVRWHTETNYGHSAPFCHPEAASPMTWRDKLWSFRTPFAIQIRSCPMARGDKLWSFRTFCHPDTIVSDGTQRQIMVIMHLVSTKRNEFGSIRMMLVARCLSFSKILQVPLAGRLIGRMVFRSNEISVLSLLPFYLQ